jgi:PAS domain S-box-containing protein
MEVALEESEERYRTQFEEALDAIFLADAETGIILDCNRAAAELVGREKSELIGKHQRILHPPERIRGEFTKTFKQHLKEKEGQVLETRVITKNGEIRDVAIKANIFQLQGRKMLQGAFRDITASKRTEDALRMAEKKFRTIFENVHDVITYVDKHGKILDVNDKVEDLLGYKRDEVVGKHFLKLGIIKLKNIPRISRLFTRTIRKREARELVELELKHKNGNKVFVEVGTRFIRNNGEVEGIVNIFRDVTERRKAEKAIRESQQKFEALFRGNPEAAVYLDLDFGILDVNPCFCQLFGYTAEEVKGKKLVEVIVPESLLEEAERLDRDAQKGYVHHETVRKRKDGSLVPVSISAATVTLEDKRAVGYVGTYKDISDLKKLEEKLRVVGSLTRHDVRNKLAVVTGNAYLLRRKLPGNAEALEHLADMENAVKNAEAIFEFARIYETLGIEKLSKVNVGKAIDEAASLFSNLKGVKIANGCHGLTVLADSLLRQLVYNLIDDSLKYGRKISHIRIRYEKAEGNQLRLVYEDDGVGIALDAKPRIFDQGYTTGKGSGLGLYLVRRIIEAYGWTIRETGTPGNGVRFIIAIPEKNQRGKENYQLR